MLNVDASEGNRGICTFSIGLTWLSEIKWVFFTFSPRFQLCLPSASASEKFAPFSQLARAVSWVTVLMVTIVNNAPYSTEVNSEQNQPWLSATPSISIRSEIFKRSYTNGKNTVYFFLLLIHNKCCIVSIKCLEIEVGLEWSSGVDFSSRGL